MKYFVIISFFILSIPYFIGLENERNVIIICQNFTDRTDSEIEDVLRVYNFDIDCYTTPSFSDYYMSGIKTLHL